MTEVHVHGPHATVRAPGLEDGEGLIDGVRAAAGSTSTRSGAGDMRFEAVVQTEDEGVFIEVPAGSELARARAPVTVTVNGYSWESSVADYGGRCYLPLRRGVRQIARIEPGDTVEVTLEPR